LSNLIGILTEEAIDVVPLLVDKCFNAENILEDELNKLLLLDIRHLLNVLMVQFIEQSLDFLVLVEFEVF
jgi:hypothetical protein